MQNISDTFAVFAKKQIGWLGWDSFGNTDFSKSVPDQILQQLQLLSEQVKMHVPKLYKCNKLRACQQNSNFAKQAILLALSFRKKVLSSLKVGEGDTLHAIETPQGVLLARFDLALVKAMNAANEVIFLDRVMLKILAKND